MLEISSHPVVKAPLAATISPHLISSMNPIRGNGLSHPRKLCRPKIIACVTDFSEMRLKKKGEISCDIALVSGEMTFWRLDRSSRKESRPHSPGYLNYDVKLMYK